MKKLNVLMFLAFAVVVAGCGKTTDMATDEAAMQTGDAVMVEDTTAVTTEEAMPTQDETNTEETVVTEETTVTTEETTNEIIDMMNDAVNEAESAN